MATRTSNIPEKGFHFRESTHTYFLDGKRMTGVTTVLGIIAKPALISWAANQAVDYIKDGFESIRVSTHIDEPQINKEKFLSLLEEARTAYAKKRDDAAQKGTDVHSIIEEMVTAAIEHHDGMMRTGRNSNEQANQFLQWAIENKVKFLESEKKMYHPGWFVGGTTDLVCEIDSKKYVGDVKTSKKIYDRIPFMQCAAYRGMLESMGEKDYHGSLIIHLPKEGKLETHFSYDYQTDLEAFLAALKLYRTLNNY